MNVQHVYLFYRRRRVHVNMWNTPFCCDCLAQWPGDGSPDPFSYIGVNWSEGALVTTYCIRIGVTASSVARF